MRVVSIAIGIAVLLVDPGEVIAAQARDSAGIRIIENPRSAGLGLSLTRDPIVQIGHQDGEAYQLSRVAGAVRLADGTIVVADGGSSQLRFYDSTGKHLKNVGRNGSGPGEFQRLQVLVKVKGDTLLAGGMFGEQSVFSPQGTFIRQTRPGEPPGGLPPGPRPIMMGALDDQARIMVAIGPQLPHPSGAERWADSALMFIVDRDAAKVRSLGRLPYMAFVRTSGGGRGMAPPWFGPVMSFATDGREIFVGFPTEYSINVYSADGALERIIRRAWSPVKVKSSDIDTYVEGWAKRWIKETGAEGERRKRGLRADPYADVVPAFSELIAATDGRLWVREPNLADAPASGSLNGVSLVPSTWNVFEANGRWSDDVTMPARFKPTDIGPHHILGIARDSDGVEMVTMYRYGTR
jgi:hypothetical protein